MKKKLLWLIPYFPYPPITGGNVRVFNIIKRLGEYLDITLLTYTDKPVSDDYIKTLEEHCSRVIVVDRVLEEGPLPLIFQHYYTSGMKKELGRLLEESFDLIQIDFLTMAYYAEMIKENSDAPLFLTDHDASTFYFDKCFHNRHLPDKERYVEWVKIQENVKKIYPLFDAVFSVSYNDADIIKEQFPEMKVYPAPTGTDCDYFGLKQENEKKDIIYVGHYLHYPNVDSVNYILEEIYPLIKEKFPGVSFNIVGSDGDKVFNEIKSIEAGDDIVVTGTVEDIRPFLYGAGVFVAPIRIGVGIRGKLLEAMSCGLPVITSGIGAEGIKAIPGRDLLVANEPQEFLDQYEKLMCDNELKYNIIENASKFVRENYDWPVMIKKIIEIYEEN